MSDYIPFAKNKMSDYIPFDIQAKILKNLPCKSLLQFRSVSKAWKSLIDSIEFIADHHQHTHQRHNHLLVKDFEQNYVSIVDDDTFPRHKFSITLPMSAKQYRKPRILGSSQGLFCLYSYAGNYSRTATAAIWNPTIRKLVHIDQLPQVDTMIFNVNVGFGVCPHTLDPKIILVSIPWVLTDTTWRVEVYRLSLGAWTSLSINLTRGTMALSLKQVVIDRFIYWSAIRRQNVELLENHLIMSFDLTSEEFTEIHVPDVITLDHVIELWIYKLKESLAVLKYDFDEFVPYFDVWIVENGVQKSFQKIYSIKFNISDIFIFEQVNISDNISVLEFRNSGEPIFLVSEDYEPSEAADEDHLYVYKPDSRRISYIGISSKSSSIFVSSYAETLLILDH